MISMETIFFLSLIMHTETKHSELCIERKNRESWLIFSGRRRKTNEILATDTGNNSLNVYAKHRIRNPLPLSGGNVIT